jgi:hypothetical protein
MFSGQRITRAPGVTLRGANLPGTQESELVVDASVSGADGDHKSINRRWGLREKVAT